MRHIPSGPWVTASTEPIVAQEADAGWGALFTASVRFQPPGPSRDARDPGRGPGGQRSGRFGRLPGPSSGDDLRHVQKRPGAVPEEVPVDPQSERVRKARKDA